MTKTIKLSVLGICLMACSLSAFAQDTIRFTWDAGTTQKSFTMHATNGETFTIDWGDGNTEPKTGQGATNIILSHTYSAASTYNVVIYANTTDCRFTL